MPTAAPTQTQPARRSTKFHSTEFNNHVEFAFFLVVRDNFKILYILFLLFIQIKFPAFKDYLCKNFKWFDSYAKKIETKW